MQSTTVPTNLTNLRVDIVGSFLRPDALKQAFDAFDAGELTPDGLQRAQDEAVAELVRTEDQHGLPIVSDGEFRRQQFMQSFTDVGGMELWLGETLQRERARKGAEVTALTKESGTEVQRPVTQRLELRRNQILDEYRAVAALTATPAKVTLIGPDRLAQRYDEQASRAVYPAVDDFVADVVRVQCEMVGQVRDAGCRYVSIDAPGYTAYVDESTLGLMRSRGQDPQRNLERSIRADNAIVEAFPGPDLRHSPVPRKRAQSMAPQRRLRRDCRAAFGGLKHQRFLLEYDDERSGGFEPLRFLPKGAIAVLGLITSKRPQLETVDELRRRIDEAARYAPLEQLALSPQCGFASGDSGQFVIGRRSVAQDRPDAGNRPRGLGLV